MHIKKNLEWVSHLFPSLPNTPTPTTEVHCFWRGAERAVWFNNGTYLKNKCILTEDSLPGLGIILSTIKPPFYLYLISLKFFKVFVQNFSKFSTKSIFFKLQPLSSKFFLKLLKYYQCTHKRCDHDDIFNTCKVYENRNNNYASLRLNYYLNQIWIPAFSPSLALVFATKLKDLTDIKGK